MTVLVRRLGLPCALLGAAFSASAGVVVLDFEEFAPAIYYENVVSKGFRISPSCHVDIFPMGGANNATTQMGWDCAGRRNPDYLGQANPPSAGDANVFVDYFEGAFDFTSFILDDRPVFVSSSKIAPIRFAQPIGWTGSYLVTLSGSQWEGVQWIQFSSACPGAPCTPVDNLSFRVPEPATFALVAAALLGSSTTRRRKPASPTA